MKPVLYLLLFAVPLTVTAQQTLQHGSFPENTLGNSACNTQVFYTAHVQQFFQYVQERLNSILS